MKELRGEKAKPPPQFFALAGFVCALPLFFIGIAVGHPDKGIAGTMAAGILVAFAAMYWRNRHRLWFWMTLGLAAVAHAAAVVLFVNFDGIGRPVIVMFSPIVLGDVIALAYAFSALEKKYAAGGRGTE